MKTLFRLFLFVLLVAQFKPVSGQGTMLYLNGKEKRFATAEIKGDFIIYKPESDQSTGVRKLEKFDVFSLQFDNGNEVIVYEPDTSYGDPTVTQVRDYIAGEQMADSIYKKPLNAILGGAFGAGGAVVSVFYGPLAPVLYATTISFFTPKVPKKVMQNELRSEDFVAGFQRKAKNKKTKNALLGGAIGFGLGVGVVLLAN